MNIRQIVQRRLNDASRQTSNGFAMPMILTFIVILGVVGTVIVQNVTQTNGSAVLHSQVQIAHIASKAAIDYAEEQYELNSSYTGTPEQDLFLNDNYRATIEVVVLYDQTSTSKRIQGIGRVYIPETSSSAKVVRDIKSTIIRNGEFIYTLGQVDPASFNPFLWLDANETGALYKSVSSNTQTITANYGTSYNDTVEEYGSDATSNKGQLDFGGDDLEMAYDGTSKGNQTIGLRFRSVNAPQGATIQNAYIQFTTDETKQAGTVQFDVRGVASDNPGSWSGNYAVTNAPKTTANTDWSPSNWNTVQNHGANERLSVTSIVQELVNRSGWTPGNSMAFSIDWTTGSGIRTAEKGSNGGNPQLFIQWAIPAGTATSDGDAIDQWYDKSGNNYTANFTYGTKPVLKVNQINGLNAVRFSADGALLSTLTTPLSSATEMTAFMVMLPRTASASDARFVSLMKATENNDTGTANAIVPFSKSGSGTTILQRYNNSTGESISSAIDGTWAVYTSQISGSGVERLLKDSTPDNTSALLNPSFSVDQVYVGGRRSSSSGANYASMDVAEIVLYNRSFSCTEIQQVENFFEAKYGISYGEKTC